MELYERANGVVAGEEGLVAGLVEAGEDGEVAAGSQPDVGEVHSVVAGVLEDCAAAPWAFPDGPTEGVVAAGGGSVEDAIGFGFEQGGLAARATQLVGEELRPVLNGAMNAARRSQDGRVVHGRAVSGDRFSLRSVAPGLIDLTGRSGAAEAGAGDAERLEHSRLHQFFPGVAGDFLGHGAGNGVPK